MKIAGICWICALAPLGWAATAFAGDEIDRKPTAGFSIVWKYVPEGRVYEGPLFTRLGELLSATSLASQEDFAEVISGDATLKFAPSGGREEVEMDYDALEAIYANCVGPYSYDEGLNWLQLSWICDPKDDTTLSKYFVFRQSPELSVTVWFDEEKKIKSWLASEPARIPMERSVPMNAYETMNSQPDQ